MTNSALDKVQLIKGTPPCQPGQCSVCGNCGDQDSEFLDIGLELDFYGVVYFCGTCLYGTILSALDLVTQEKHEEVTSKLLDQELQNTALKLDIQELRGIIESLTNNHGFGSSDSRSSATDKQSTVAAQPESPKPTSSKSTATKSRSAKSTNESGSTDVRVDDSTKKFDL